MSENVNSAQQSRKNSGILTEIRVHGVGGTPPEEILVDMHPKKVAGDKIAGFYRTTDDGGRHREAYSWGGLTSHSPLRVLWTALLPSMLANMAGWMARRSVKSGEHEGSAEPTTPSFRWLARLAALALTLSSAVMVSILSFDVIAYQCLGLDACRARLGFIPWLATLAPERPGMRLAVGISGPVAIAVLFYFLSLRSRNSYERVEPPTPEDSLPAPSSMCAAAQKGGLRHVDFWSGRRWHQHLSDLHLAAFLAVTTGLLGWGVFKLAEFRPLSSADAAGSALFAVAASVAILIAVSLMLRWDNVREDCARAALMVSWLILLLAVIAAWLLPGFTAAPSGSAGQGAPGVSAQPAGVLPGLGSSVTVVWMFVLFLLVLLGTHLVYAWGARWRKAWRETQHETHRLRAARKQANGSFKVFPFAAPLVLNVVAVIVANAVLLSLMALVIQGLGEVRYGYGPHDVESLLSGGGAEPAAGDGSGSILWVPGPIIQVTAALSLALIIVLALFGIIVLLALVWGSRMTARKVMQRLKDDYELEESRAGVRFAHQEFWEGSSAERRAAWDVSAFDAVFSGDRIDNVQSQNAARSSSSPRPTAWVRGVARAHLIGKWAPAAAAVLTIGIAVGGTVAVALFITRVYVPPPWVIGLTTSVSVLLPLLYGAVVRAMFRREKVRKALMSAFDVGTFFPRSFHPFAPPSYTERAVPELTRRIWWLHDFEGPVVLVAHSQGSALAAAVLARESKRSPEDPAVGLVTLGSPLAKLYRWAFPALLSDELLQNLARGRGGTAQVRWRNVYYATDYIGGPVVTDGWEVRNIDVRLVDPATHRFVFGQPRPPVLSHTGYWHDPRFWRAVNDMSQEIAPRVNGEPGGGAVPGPDLAAVEALDSAALDPDLPVSYR